MTAKEKLRQALEELTEREAQEMLGVIADRRGRDLVVEHFESAPYDDEPSAPEEDRSAADAWAQRHDSVPLSEIERELG